MIKILLVEDYAIVRDGLKQLLTAQPDMRVTGEAGSGQEAIDLVQKGLWDVMILELSLADRSGIEVLQFMQHLPTPPPVIVLTIHDEQQYGPRLMRMGAAGFLTKRAATHELVSAIRLVVQGQLYVTPALAKLLLAKPDRLDGQPRHTVLSDREFQVVCQIVYGKTISEIADELSVSVSTVSTHRARALEKMHMKSNAELVQYAIWHRLVPCWNPEAPTPSEAPPLQRLRSEH